VENFKYKLTSTSFLTNILSIPTFLGWVLVWFYLFAANKSYELITLYKILSNVI